jgi:polar amino acid transport system substrate-binding protein
MRRFARIAAPALALGLVLAACSSDDESTTEDTTAATEETTAAGDTTAPATEETAGGDVDVAALGLIKEGALTVCTDAPYPPFEFQDEATEEWTGFDMDLMRAIATKAKTCDIVASAMTITEERAANALFTDPYFDADQSLLVRAEDAETVTSLEALEGKKLAVQTGTTGETYANENAKGATIQSFDEPAAMFLALEGGQVDAILQDLPVNAERALKGEDTKLTATFPTGEQYGFAVAQDNTALAEAVNGALAEVKDSGEYDTIYAKYFGAKG